MAFLSGLLLTGCGSSDTTPSTPTTPSPSPSPGPAPGPSPTGLQLTASPARFLTTGGSSTVTITGRLTNAAGAGVAGQAVQFSTTAGSLSNTLPTTSAAGEATVTLTTSSSATVLASAAGLNGSVNVEAVAPFTVRVEPKYSVAIVNEDDDVSVIVTQGTGFPDIPTPNAVVLTCGNGTTYTFSGSDHAPCRYREKGVFEVTAVARATTGYSATGRSTITVQGAAPTALTLTAREKGRSGGEVEFEFTVVGAPTNAVCEWDLGTAKPKPTVCHYSINYSSGEGGEDGDITVSVAVDTKDGADIQHLETTVHIG